MIIKKEKAFLVCKLPQDCRRKSDSVNGLLLTAVFTNHPAVDVWASASEEDLPVAEKLATADGNGHL